MRNSEIISAAARTVGVMFGGVVLSFLLIVALSATLAPDTQRLLSYQLGIRPLPKTHAELIQLANQMHVNRLVLRWVITPLVGIGVGLFVGLLQRSRPGLVAAICLAPTSLQSSYYPIRFYPYPLIERAQIVAPDFLSVLCAIVVAVGIWRLRNRKKPNMAGVTMAQG